MRKRIIIPVSGGIDSSYLVLQALADGHEVYPVAFDDTDLDCQEGRAANELIDVFRQWQDGPSPRFPGALLHPMTELRIPRLDQLKIQYPITHRNPEQAEAMKDIDYWSGWKALMYATTLAFGGAIGAEEIQFGVYEWNVHFQDELPESAYIFNRTWQQLYPDLRVPVITFPLLGRSKPEIIQAAHNLQLPFSITWSCLKDDHDQCGECIGCKHRHQEFVAAGIIDPTHYMTDPSK